VVRHAARATDSHVHLAVYFIHPESVRPGSSAFPNDVKDSSRTGLYVNGNTSKGSKSSPQLGGGAPTFERSPRSRQTTGSSTVFDPENENDEHDDDDDDEDDEDVDGEDEMVMHRLDIRMIKKLGKRVNVLPVSIIFYYLSVFSSNAYGIK
jgi:hypothetical protein